MVERDEGRVMRGRCLPYGQGAGYQAFASVVADLAGIRDSDTPETAREKLHAAAAAVLPGAEAGEVAEGLALLSGVSNAAAPPQQLMLFFYARRFLECVATGRPSAVVFEDIHWAQPSELELLAYLAKHVREVPLLVVAAARPELLDGHPGWGSGLTAHTTILLEPLPADAAAVLAAELVPPDHQSRLGIRRIIETAGGNPLFLEELSAALSEGGGGETMPVTVREAIGARIDALPPDVRRVLLAAAVVGRTFWRGITAALDDSAPIDAALMELEVRDFVRRDPKSDVVGDAQFTFKHMLIREVAYAMLPRATRRARHAAVAAYVESTLPKATEALAPILAHHWREAGEGARAVPYLVAAARAARRGWAQAAGIDLYSAAIELAEDAAERRALRLERAIALVGWWEMDRAAEELRELLPELEGDERLEALIALAHAYVWTERDEDALATALDAAAAGEDVAGSTRAAVIAAESQALAMRGAEGDLERAWQLGEQALDLWHENERRLDLAHHLHLHTDVAYWTGRYDRALDLARRTRAVASDAHVAEAFLRGVGSEALSLAGLGRHEEAIAIWDGVLPAADELGQSRRVLLNYSSLAYRELYDVEEARRRSEEALALSPEGGFGMPRQFAGSDLLLAHLLAGDVGRAEAEWLDRWKGVGHATAWTTWLIAGRLALTRSLLELEKGDHETALEWAHQSLEIARRTGRRKYEARSLTAVGEALAGLGRRDGALAALTAAVPLADALVGAPARWEARAALGSCGFVLGDDDTAARAYAESAELVRSFAATLSPERAERFLHAPQAQAILSPGG
jgi:tetratricopeptide (TPR) repeat protein